MLKKILNRLGELIFLNLLFILTSIPLITIGAGVSAIYEVIELIDKDMEINLLAVYFQKFRKNFKKTLPINIILLIIIILFLITFNFLLLKTDILGKLMLYLYISSTLLIYMSLSRYYYFVGRNSERKNIELINFSLYSGITNLKFSLLTVILPIVLFLSIFFSKYTIIVWEFLIVIGFTLICYINFKVFKLDK